MKRRDYATLLGLADDDFVRLRFLGEAAYAWLVFGEPEKAEAILEAIELIAPECPVGPLGRAEIGLDRKDYPAVEAAARRALQCRDADPGSMGQAFVLQARASLARGRPAQARKLLGKAREVDPAGASGAEAGAWLDDMERIDRAIAATTDPEPTR